jgi:hypothetical protein
MRAYFWKRWLASTMMRVGSDGDGSGWLEHGKESAEGLRFGAYLIVIHPHDHFIVTISQLCYDLCGIYRANCARQRSSFGSASDQRNGVEAIVIRYSEEQGRGNSETSMRGREDRRSAQGAQGHRGDVLCLDEWVREISSHK